MVEHNRVSLELASIPENVGVARLVVSAVAAQADFTLVEVDEVKLAVSEAMTNAVVHGYRLEPAHLIRLDVTLQFGVLQVVISDQGQGIENIERAMQPAVTSDPDRMGLGFCFMQSHMDSLQVDSAPGCGTRVTMTKRTSLGQCARATAN